MTGVIVIAEHRGGAIRDESYQLITAGRELADALDTDLSVAVIGDEDAQFAPQLDRAGVDRVLTVAYDSTFNHDVYVQAVRSIAHQYDPQYILTVNSVNGLDYAPAVAADLDLPIVTDIVGFSYSESLSVTREMYGSKVTTDLSLSGDKAVLTVRASEWPPTEASGDAAIESVTPEIDPDAIKTTVSEIADTAGGDVDISTADFVISIGRGIDEEDNLDLIRELVDVTDATLASSRPIVDNGWLPPNRQVGQSGKSIAPDIYLAIGISGAVQHLAGITNAETIIAINSDPQAPIFDVADYGIVDDLFEVVPELITRFETN